MKINNLWDKELTITDNQRQLADQISNDLMASLKRTQSVKDCEIDSIEIETVNRCNNDCSFCPVNIYSDKREKCKMSVELFHKIIDDLKAINYKGTISLYSNNEPLLDNRIYDFIGYVNKNLPEARQELYTNGLLLTPEKLGKLSVVLAKLVIDIYCEKEELPNHMLWLRKYPEMNNVAAVIRNKNQVLTSRAGNAPNKASIQNYNSFCIYPFKQMIIRPDGKVSKCCHDAYGEATMGDLSHESVLDVWKGEKYKEFRNKMISNGRACFEGCQKCDALIYDYPMSAEERNELKSELIRVLKQKADDGSHVYIAGSGEKTNRLISELKKLKIEYLVLCEETRNLFFEDKKGFLLLNYYSDGILKEIMAEEKKYPEDFIIYYRCF